MKKSIITLAVSLMGFDSFASTIACQVRGMDGKSVEKVFVVEKISKNPDRGLLLEEGGSRYYLSVSDIYKEKDLSVLSDNAMVISSVTSADAPSDDLVITDGKIMMYVNKDKAIAVFCSR